MSDEIAVHTVKLDLCELCISGEGGECHVPGCALWINRAPDLRIDTHPSFAVIPDTAAGDDTLRDQLIEVLVTEWMQRSDERVTASPTEHCAAMADAVLPRIAEHTATVEAELIDLRALFDLQQTRMAEATTAWQAENPAERENVLPYLGDLLAWLMQRAERAEDGRDVERTALRNAMDRISKAIEHAAHQTGVTSFATAKAWRRQLDILNRSEATP